MRSTVLLAPGLFSHLYPCFVFCFLAEPALFSLISKEEDDKVKLGAVVDIDNTVIGVPFIDRSYLSLV